MSIDGTTLPSDLLVAPQPLIGFCGLNVAHNVVHKSIWDAFSTNRKADRAVVQFKLLPPNYEFPVAKPKRTSYEWYHPKGILKRNWMLKHLHVLPSVVVLFQDLEWNDPQWSEKQLQCASMVQALKNMLQERNTRLCLVLMQKSAPLPPGEDLMATERVASLTSACGLTNKVLFILPHTEHLMGYILRLESAFLDMAQSYYALMSKRIRAHRDQLTTAHIMLKIRHQFKLGFVAEIRQDYSTALKHYTQAYANLDEIRITDANCLEIKTVAGFLNYKICRLMFKLKVPRDAINHFISHIDKYKSRVGFKDLIFEHYAWLSTQHSAFAELFCEAIKNGLPALQTQHPGIYFQKAAEYIMKRRDAFQQACAALLSPTEPTTPTTLQNNSVALYTEFFGIRALKTGEPLPEQQINVLIRDNEKSFNHSSVIITLLGQAMAQFKIYKCLRFRKKLAIDMAEEYFKVGDHAKALTLYSLMLPDYRQDRWPLIFSDVLLKTLRCALLSASVGDYVSCSIEALSLKIPNQHQERIIVLENLWKIFQCVPPISQCQIAPEIRDLWENALTSVKSPIQVDLDKLIDVVETCAAFENVRLKNDEVIKVHLLLKLLTDVPVKMQCFSLHLTDGTNVFKLPALEYTTFANLLELRESQCADKALSSRVYHNLEGDLKMEPGLYYKLLFTTDAQQFFENTQLRVIRIEAHMGTEKLLAILTKSAGHTRNPFRHHSRCKDLDDNFTINPMCYITPTFHLVTQTNLGDTMLVNEYHAVMTTVSNPHNVFLQNVGIKISVPNHLRNKVFLTTDISPSRQKLHSLIQIDIGEMSVQSSNTASFYIFSLVATEIALQQSVWYVMDVMDVIRAAVADGLTPGSADNSPAENVRVIVTEELAFVAPPVQIEFIDETRMRKTREDTLSINCELEFKFTGRFYTLHKQPLQKVYRGENFLLRINIGVQTSFDVDILETFFICDHNLVQSKYSFQRKNYTMTYRSGDKLEDVIVLRSNATLDDWLTAKYFERKKSDGRTEIFSRPRSMRKQHFLTGIGKSEHLMMNNVAAAATSPNVNKNLIAKIPTNMTIIGSTSVPNSLMVSSQGSVMGTSTSSDDGRAESTDAEADRYNENATQAAKVLSSRLVYNKAIEAIQTTGHCRGFIKGVVTTDQPYQQQGQPYFGVYCIKWRRNGGKDENESKFIITGLDIECPPLNIYCSIEEKMFVKMPMTFKVVLKNPTAKVLHLITTLSISNTDNFICAGHKQLDISIFAYGEKELVYNLYPLCAGWQHLPGVTLEYNTQADPSKSDAQNKLLSELVQRVMPKKVFILVGCLP